MNDTTVLMSGHAQNVECQDQKKNIVNDEWKFVLAWALIYIFDVGGYNITVTTGFRREAGTDSIVHYRLQGTNGDSGTRVFPGQVATMFESERYSQYIIHKMPVWFYFVKSRANKLTHGYGVEWGLWLLWLLFQMRFLRLS